MTKPTKKKVLQVSYKSQRDNKYNPSGSCNVTSIAMCVCFHGIKGDGSEKQLEDQLYRYCQETGLSRHDPNDLAYMVNERFQGIVKDAFTNHGTFDDIRKAIDEGNPCVVHGYFTQFGHIIVIKGYDDTGFIVNDPWGEYHSDGYDTSVSGEGLHYSYKLMARVCSPESEKNPCNIWLHVIKKA